MAWMFPAVTGFIVGSLFGGNKHTTSEKHEYHADPNAEANFKQLQAQLDEQSKQFQRKCQENKDYMEKLRSDFQAQQKAAAQQNEELRTRLQSSFSKAQEQSEANLRQVEQRLAAFERGRVELLQFCETRREEIRREEAIKQQYTRETEQLRQQRQQQDQQFQRELEEAALVSEQAARTKEQEYRQWLAAATADQEQRQARVMQQMARQDAMVQDAQRAFGQHVQSVQQASAAFDAETAQAQAELKRMKKEVTDLFGEMSVIVEASQRSSMQSRSMGSQATRTKKVLATFDTQIAPFFPGCNLERASQIFVNVTPEMQASSAKFVSRLRSREITGSLGTGCSEVCPLIAFLQVDGGVTFNGACNAIGKCEGHSESNSYKFTFEDPSKMKVVSFAPHVHSG